VNWVRSDAIAEVAEALKSGEIAIVPTETVYGLASTLEPDALLKVFRAKGRPDYKPLIVGVSSAEMAKQLVEEWPDKAEQLVSRFWPGPLSIVLPKATNIPYLVTAGGKTVAVRAPGHEITLGLIERVGKPLILTSANLTGGAAPKSAPEAVAQLGLAVSYVIDDGPATLGIESTVYDVLAGKVLRQGAIPGEDLG
jgi:L-threonylcarbamoyladenylate synthase